MKSLYLFSLVLISFLLASCASQRVYECPTGTLQLPDCPPADAVNDESINALYQQRTWIRSGEQTFDVIELGEQASIPINSARAKIIGPTYDEALRSLAAKLWLIENAEHTVDAMYYIFKRDPVGYAILGALCNAVKRGVDVRIMVDSLGSMHPGHSELRALETCTENAGFMRNADGQLTTKKARAQVVIFNAITRFQFNRRSHDKLLVVDGQFPVRAAVMTGGRNISLDYYGINEDGTPDPTAFRDLEILLRSGDDSSNEEYSIGRVSGLYYKLLFLHKGNRRIWPYEADDEFDEGKYDDIYINERRKAQDNLVFLKSLPKVRKHLEQMPDYMNSDFRNAEVRLAHQLGNLTNTNVTTNVRENLQKNPNSIMYLIYKLLGERLDEGEIHGTLRIVSPYLFSPLYKDADGEVVYDGVKELLQVLNENPGLRIEVITNSVMTSDNFFTQAIIDIDMAPRLLLTPEMHEIWKSSVEEGEFNPEFVESEHWTRQVNHPQIFIYETGKLDSVLLGKGSAYYGKLHAKFILGTEGGFIGTSNFDYRSNLYNNEMGYLFRSPDLREDVIDVFDWLKASSYRWGSPEWLKMRRELMDADTAKSGPARNQRGIYKTIKALGLEYLM